MVSTRMGYYPTIHSLFSMIPRETREHMERVGRYSQIIFEQLSKENPELVEKEFGNRFAKFSEDIFKYHDIGRIYISINNSPQYVIKEIKKNKADS